MLCVVGGISSMLFDPSAVRKDGTNSVTALVIAFVTSSFASIMYLVNSKLVGKIPPWTLVMFLNAYMWLWSSIIGKISDKNVEIFSFDPNQGCLGFLAPSTIVFGLLVFGLVGGLIYSAGSIISLTFFAPTIVSLAGLSEPFVAQLEAYFLGLDAMPGALTWLGASLAMVGVILFY